MSLNLEDSVIALLITPEAMEKAWDAKLNLPGLFKDPVKAGVLQFIFDYWFKADRKLAATHEVVKYQFPSYKYVEPEEDLTWLIDSIIQRYKDTAVWSAIEEMAETAGEKSDSESALRLMSSRSYEIAEMTTNRESLSNLAENVGERYDRYQERALFKGDVKGVPLGFSMIDQFTFGTLPGELTAIGAATNVGKSWVLCKSVLAARLAGYTPYFATLEMSREDMEDRIDCIHAGVSYGRMMKGKLLPEQKKRLEAAREELAALGTIFVDHPPESERTVQNLLNRARQRGADAFVLDQLSFVVPRHAKYDRPDLRVVEITNELKVSLREGSSMAGIMAVQFNREERKAGRPALHNFADSVNVERVVDNAYGLNRSDEMKLNNSLEIILMKSRRAEVGVKWLIDWKITDNETSFVVNCQIKEGVDEMVSVGAVPEPE